MGGFGGERIVLLMARVSGVVGLERVERVWSVLLL